MIKERFSQLLWRVKSVRFSDIIQVFPMITGFLLSFILRIRHRNVWLVCERYNEARDNGYWFYKYLCENHPEIEAVYSINKNCNDYHKVRSLGHVISFGTIKHWAYYFLAQKNISSQKDGKPNPPLCFFLEVICGLMQNRVYLKHGIIKDYQRWIFYDLSKINLFICGAQREYDYISRTFGYPSGVVVFCGLSRFDNLLAPHETKRQIVVMPTMRRWLKSKTDKTLKYEVSYEFTDSEYYKSWSGFLNDNRLALLLDEYNVNLVFYLHSRLQKFSNCFDSNHNRIKIGKADDYEVQQLLMESSVLITDYSSVYFDFAYMQKPLLYYQFDYEKYREGQYQQGYFFYQEDGFGPVATNENELLEYLHETLSDNMVMGEKYLKRSMDFFAYHDGNNSQRIYDAIINMG